MAFVSQLVTGLGKLFVAGVLLLLAACEPNENSQREISEYQIIALGTIVSISLYDEPVSFASKTFPLVEEQIKQDEHRWRSFGQGELGQVNQALARGDCATLSESTRELVDTALRMQKLSNGLFDPALGIDVDRYGFRDISQAPRIPKETNIPAAQLTLSANELCTSHAARIDLGGIAKGAIIERLTRLLSNAGITDAIINAGGDLFVMGSRGERPWRIAIQHPRKMHVVAALPASAGEAWFTSGDYFRFTEIDNTRTHHIIDPHTRRPATGAIAATVISNNPLLADAAATALMVAGPARMDNIARRMGVARVILIDHDLSVHQWPDASLALPASLKADTQAP